MAPAGEGASRKKRKQNPADDEDGELEKNFKF
jgi:hypothetical protein